MFKLIREKVSLPELLQLYNNDTPLIECGTDTQEFEDKVCPFCEHRDCFKVKHNEDEPGESFYRCFSCEETGDAITIAQKYFGIDSQYRAALKLAKHFNIEIPREHSPVQEIFEQAASYYKASLGEATKPLAKLSDLSPLEYQKQVRKHSVEVVDQLEIGWSDGGLIEYLESLGFDKELIEASGLMNKRGKDFLPNDTFIYPHRVNGRVSHFTFKDPLKQLNYQLSNKHKLNGYQWYGQDTLKGKTKVAIVEGENDLAALIGSDWDGGVLASIGQVSGAQLEWLTGNLKGMEVVTFFDNDDAGNKYRAKLEKLKRSFKSLIQYVPTTVKDIDEWLSAGRTLEAAFANFQVYQEGKTKTDEILDTVTAEGGSEAGVEVDSEDSGLPTITEHKGAYYKLKYKDGEPVPVKISNFTLKLRNVFIQGEDRQREVILTREDGKRSSPIAINSEVKVSVKPFKVLAANAVDGSFYGSELDMMAVWDYVYKTCKEKEVFLPTVVGRVEQFKGWLFRDCFIADSGEVIRPDDEGIFWVGGATAGIKPVSLNTEVRGKDLDDSADIPQVISNWDQADRVSFGQEFCNKLGENLGNQGLALTMVAWAMATAYSNVLFKRFGFFPFLFLWGRNGKGKTFISKWILSIFGMDEIGSTTISQLKSGVGFERKVAYFSSLPTHIDEIRTDRETADFQGLFRSWYNRSKRTLGLKEGFGVKEREVLATFIFSGEDLFPDPAARQRCIPIRVPTVGRETETTFRWIEERKGLLPVLAYHWIRQSSEVPAAELLRTIEKIDIDLIKSGCNPRTSKNWAIISTFGEMICKDFQLEFDFAKYVSEMCKEDSEEQSEDNMIVKFFEQVEQLQSEENSPITGEVIAAEGKDLYIWFANVYRKVAERARGIAGDERFSRNALLQSIREESYCVDGDTRKALGLSVARRRCIKIDTSVESCPESLRNIVEQLTNRS